MNMINVQTPNPHVKAFEDMENFGPLPEYEFNFYNKLPRQEQLAHRENIIKYNTRIELINELRKKNVLDNIFTQEEIEKFCPDHDMESYDEDGSHGYECATCGALQTG